MDEGENWKRFYDLRVYRDSKKRMLFDIHFVVLTTHPDAPTASSVHVDHAGSYIGYELFRREVEILNENFVDFDRNPICDDDSCISFCYKNHQFYDDIGDSGSILLEFGDQTDPEKLENDKDYYKRQFSEAVWACGDRRLVDPFAINVFIIDRHVKDPCLFSWDDIPGNDNEKLVDFLKQDYSIDWIKTAKIEKIDNGKTIKISTKKNYLFLKLNDEQTEINLIINDGRTDKFFVKIENGKLNIYKESNVVHSTRTCQANYNERKVNGKKYFRPYILFDVSRLLHNHRSPEEHEMGHIFGLNHNCDPSVVASNDDSNIMQIGVEYYCSGGQRNQGFGIIWFEVNSDGGTEFNQIPVILTKAKEIQDSWSALAHSD